MKVKFIRRSLIALLAILTFNSCQKEMPDFASALEELNNPEQPVTVQAAKLYLKNLRKQQGNIDAPLKGSKSIPKFSKNKKFVVFSKAYTGETSTATFIEAPILYNRRSVPIIRTKGETKNSQADTKIRKSSIDRLVIFKDKKTGKVGHSIVTFLPTEEYLTKRNGDISRNHIDRLDNEFSGYLIFKNWKGKIVGIREVRDGKLVYAKKTNINKLASDSKTPQGKKSTAGFNGSICEWECSFIDVDIYEMTCYDVNPENGTWSCEYEFIGTEHLNVCVPQQNPPAGCSTPPIEEGETYIVPDPYNEGAVICPNLQDRPTENCIMSNSPSSGPAGTYVRFDIFGVYVLPGYTWMVFENIVTNVEYKIPIAAPDGYLMPPCIYWWYVTVQLPPTIPAGEYYMKWECDGEVFYYESRTFVKRKFEVTP
ncbi:hypothetical protein HDC92_001856 [Pedobacter sp. AK017]|uniref:hypothetical protein n=1 Tax=Pedobacter sp. AK017 TaxID=2723073 RepID=UPI0016172FAF|nr:hypothetical protein [Pedobacter sp. AK017]MBB5438181.1 hypothetical protein [Pedobacter sp. AK017]